MALIEKCFCCSLALTAAVIGVYSLVSYVIAFVTELWWILESSDSLPVPAYFLCLVYFTLFIVAGVLLHGLSVTRTMYLLVWLFVLGILIVPEGCLVLYMSIHHWQIATFYGIIETTCWVCRLLVNMVGIVCIQSLYVKWKEEKDIFRRLNALKTSSSPEGVRKPKIVQQKQPQNLSYQNFGFYSSTENLKRYHYRMPESTLTPDIVDAPYLDEIQGPSIVYSDCIEGLNLSSMYHCSEFNASLFDANIIKSRLKNMPYLTLQRTHKKENDSLSRCNYRPRMNLLDSRDFGDPVADEVPSPKVPNKTRSLLDLREKQINNADERGNRKISRSISLNYINKLCTTEKVPSVVDLPKVTQSLDRKILKSNLLPKLKKITKLSPFLSKKMSESETEINIYRVNPPVIKNNTKETISMTSGNNKLNSNFSDSNLSSNISNLQLDGALKKIYSVRGMYVFDEKFRKIIFYPPEYFNPEEIKKFRSRMDSYSSSQSRNSVTTDSDDIRHISDVAL